MIRVLAAVSLLLAACPAVAMERRKTVYLDGLAAFERHVRAAIDRARLRLSVIEEPVRPDYRMFLDPKFKNVQAQNLYRKATGRTENAVLELWDVRGKRGVVRHEFRLTADEAEQRRAAQVFVEKIRNQMRLEGPEGDLGGSGDAQSGPVLRQ